MENYGSVREMDVKVRELYPNLLEGLDLKLYAIHGNGLINKLCNKYKNDLIDDLQQVTDNYEEDHTTYAGSLPLIVNEEFVVIGDFSMYDSNYAFLIYSNKSSEYLNKKFTEELSDVKTYDYGIYTLNKDMFKGWAASKIKLSVEDYIVINNDLDKELIKDVNEFFSNRKFYNDNNLSYKRGLLMYGSPGTGKTQLSRIIMSNIKDTFCLIINSDDDVGDSLYEFIIDNFEGENKIVLFEDIDSLSNTQRSNLLNFIDGVKGNEGTYFIATTNHPEKLDSAVSNRPSRFDTVVEIEKPNKNSRSQLLSHYFPSLKGDLLSSAVKKTDGFSGAYFKELFIYCKLKNVDLDEAINRLQKQNRQFLDYKSESNDMFG